MYVHIQEIEFTVKHLKEKSGPNWALVVSSIKHLSNKTNSIETLPDNRKFLDSCMRPVLLRPKWNKKIVLAIGSNFLLQGSAGIKLVNKCQIVIKCLLSISVLIYLWTGNK